MVAQKLGPKNLYPWETDALISHLCEKGARPYILNNDVMREQRKSVVSWWMAIGRYGTVDATGNWIDRLVLSVDGLFGNADDRTSIELSHSGPLAAGANYTASAAVTLPTQFEGTLQWIVRTDALGAVVEPDTRADNTSAPTPTAITTSLADLTVEAVSAPTAALSGTAIEIAWRVRNAGDATATGSWQDRLVLSQDDVFDAGDIVLATVNRSGPLAVGDAYTVRQSFILPGDSAGAWRVLVRSDVDGAVLEGGRTGNNTGATASALVISPAPAPNLVVSAVVAPAFALAGSTVAATWTVTNPGEATAAGPWVDRVFYSPNGQLAGATLLGSRTRSTALATGESYEATLQVTLPSVAHDWKFKVPCI
jgi:hypothetical protein